MFTISTHDNNIKHADPVIIFHYVYQNRFLFFCSFLRILNRFGLAIIISISKILVKKSTDLKLNLPLCSRLSFLRRSFSCGIGLIFVVFLLFFIPFFFFFGGGRRPGTFFRCNTFNAFSSITFFFGGGGGRSGTFFRCNAFNALNALNGFWSFFGCLFFLSHDVLYDLKFVKFTNC